MPPSDPAAFVPAESVSARVFSALLYPVAGAEALVLIALAVMQSFPKLSRLAIPVMFVYVLAIIRASTEGKRKMPAWVGTDSLRAVFLVWLRAILVSAIALWPMFVWILYWDLTKSDDPAAAADRRLIAGLIVTGALSLIYYPACLVMLALRGSVGAALNPVLIFRTILAMGKDYMAALLAWILATGLALIVARPLGRLFSGIPVFDDLPRHGLWIWAQFYGAHLLGWAAHRHAVELGWNSSTPRSSGSVALPT